MNIDSMLRSRLARTRSREHFFLIASTSHSGPAQGIASHIVLAEPGVPRSHDKVGVDRCRFSVPESTLHHVGECALFKKTAIMLDSASKRFA